MGAFDNIMVIEGNNISYISLEETDEESSKECEKKIQLLADAAEVASAELNRCKDNPGYGSEISKSCKDFLKIVIALNSNTK